MPQNTGSGQTPAPVGEVTVHNLGFIVINNANGKLELFQGPTIIGGLTGGNLRSMLTAQKMLELEFAKKSELTTDEASADDAPETDSDQQGTAKK